MVSDRKLVEVMPFRRVHAPSDKWQSLSATLRHDDEAHLLELGSQVIGSACQVEHDGAIATLAQADQLVVLTDDLRCAFGKVESEGGLISAQVVDVEDELFGKELWVTPDNPADTWVDLKTVSNCGDIIKC